jgi:hypothetical protein
MGRNPGQERPMSGFLRKRAFPATAAVPDRWYRLRLPGPGFVRWCPALPGLSGHGVLAPGNPAYPTAVRGRRPPGRTSHPCPTPLNRFFSCSPRTARAPDAERSPSMPGAPSGPGIVTPRGFRGQVAYCGVQKSMTVPSPSRLPAGPARVGGSSGQAAGAAGHPAPARPAQKARSSRRKPNYCRCKFFLTPFLLTPFLLGGLQDPTCRFYPQQSCGNGTVSRQCFQ